MSTDHTRNLRTNAKYRREFIENCEIVSTEINGVRTVEAVYGDHRCDILAFFASLPKHDDIETYILNCDIPAQGDPIVVFKYSKLRIKEFFHGLAIQIATAYRFNRAQQGLTDFVTKRPMYIDKLNEEQFKRLVEVYKRPANEEFKKIVKEYESTDVSIGFLRLKLHISTKEEAVEIAKQNDWIRSEYESMDF